MMSIALWVIASVLYLAVCYLASCILVSALIALGEKVFGKRHGESVGVLIGGCLMLTYTCLQNPHNQAFHVNIINNLREDKCNERICF